MDAEDLDQTVDLSRWSTKCYRTLDLAAYRVHSAGWNSPYAYLCKECSRRLLPLRSRSQTGSGLGGFEYVRLLEPRGGGALIGGGGGGKKLCKHA